MKPGSALRHFLLALALALVGYAVLYGFVQHRRVARGPWLVTFTSASAVPAMVVDQPKLGIAEVRVTFPGNSAPANPAQSVAFSEARPVPFDLPFGKCVFLDPLFLPGTVALEMFGHQIQLLPRVLTIDGREHPWQSGATIVVTSTNAASHSP